MRSIPGVLVLAAVLALVSLAPSFGKPVQPSAREQVEKLVAVLKSDAPQKEKADACRELARTGTTDAVAPLAALLGDEQLSHMARYALETIPGSAADKALRDALKSLRGRLLVGVIGSIGVRRDKAAVKPLAGFLQDIDQDVREAAARALGSIGSAAAVKALEKALPDVPAVNQLAFCEGLLRCAESLEAAGRRKQAIEIYDRLRVLDAPHQVRTAAWRGAILARQKDGLPLLLEAINSNDSAQFAAGARLAQQMPGTEVTRALNAQLDKLPAGKQIVLVQALGKRGDPAALPALFTLAKGSAKPVRLAAIKSLAEIGDPTAIPVLVESLSDTNTEVAQTAQESLGGLPGFLNRHVPQKSRLFRPHIGKDHPFQGRDIRDVHTHDLRLAKAVAAPDRLIHALE